MRSAAPTGQFRQTEIGELPAEWQVVPLSDVADISGGSTPSTRNERFWNGEIPFVTPSDITKLESLYLRNAEKQISREGLESISAALLPPGSVLITSRASIGLVAINEIPVVTNQGFANLVCKPSVHNTFLAQVMRLARPRLERLGAGSTFREVSRTSIRKFPVPLPPIVEQRRIAEILSAADEAVQKTDAVISELERLKKGLMQRLLTRGTGHSKLKATEIGEVPLSWQACRIKEIIAEAKNGFASGQRTQDGVVQLRLDSLDLTGFVNPANYVRVPSPAGVDEYRLRPGDILVANTTGSVDHIGKSVVYRAEFDQCVFSNHLTRLRVNADVVLSAWLQAVLFRHWQMGVFRKKAVSQAGGQRNIPASDLLSLVVPVPPIAEQHRAVNVLSQADQRLQRERRLHQTLQELKSGLMQQLLTGKLRVKV